MRSARRQDPPIRLSTSATVDRAGEEAQIADFLRERGATACPPSNDPTIDETLGPLVWDQSARRLTRRPAAPAGRRYGRHKVQAQNERSWAESKARRPTRTSVPDPTRKTTRGEEP